MTIVAGVVALFVLVDLPEQAGSWLTEDEKAWVVYRKATDGSSVGEAKHISWKYVKAAFSDFQCWCGLGFYIGILTPLYGVRFGSAHRLPADFRADSVYYLQVGLFTPSLINSFGKWTRPQVQLLTGQSVSLRVSAWSSKSLTLSGSAPQSPSTSLHAPMSSSRQSTPVRSPAECSPNFLSDLPTSSDRMKTRFWFLIAAQTLCLLGFAINRESRAPDLRRARYSSEPKLILLPSPVTPAPTGVKFFGLFLAAMGAYGGV